MIYAYAKVPFIVGKSRKDLEVALRSAAKGSGWKVKNAVLFRQVEDWFIAAHHRSIAVEGGVGFQVEMMAKPMLIDPLYWADNGLAPNINEPLSFRYWGAFICGVPVVSLMPVDGDDAPQMAAAMMTAADTLLPVTLARLRSESFVDIASAPLAIHDNYRMADTVRYARILAEAPEAAREIARDLKANPRPFEGSRYRIMEVTVGGGEGIKDRLSLDRFGDAPVLNRGVFARLFGKFIN